MSEISFSPGGGDLPSQLMTEDGTIFTLHAAEQSQPPVRFTACAIDAAGERIVAADADYNLYVLDLVQQRYSPVCNMGIEAQQVAFSNSEPTAVYAAMASGVVRCYDTATGTLLTTLQGHKTPVTSVAQNANGSVLLTVSSDLGLLWSVDAASRAWSMTRSLGSAAGIAHAALVASAGLLAVAFRDDSVIVYDASNNNEVVAQLGLPEAEAGAALQFLALTADGSILAAAGANGCVYVWDVRTQEILRIIDAPVPARSVLAVQAFSADVVAASLAGAAGAEGSMPPSFPQIAILGDDGRMIMVELGEVVTAVLEAEGRGGVGGVTSFAISDDARLLVTLTDDGRLTAFDVPTAKVFRLEAMRSQTSGTGTGTGDDTTGTSSFGASGSLGGSGGGVRRATGGAADEEGEESILQQQDMDSANVSGLGVAEGEEGSSLQMHPLPTGAAAASTLEKPQLVQSAFAIMQAATSGIEGKTGGAAVTSPRPASGSRVSGYVQLGAGYEQRASGSAAVAPGSAPEASRASPGSASGGSSAGSPGRWPASTGAGDGEEEEEMFPADDGLADTTPLGATRGSSGLHGRSPRRGGAGAGTGAGTSTSPRTAAAPSPPVADNSWTHETFIRSIKSGGAGAEDAGGATRQQLDVDGDGDYRMASPQYAGGASARKGGVLVEGHVPGLPDPSYTRRAQRVEDGFAGRDRGAGSIMRGSGATAIAARASSSGGVPGSQQRAAAGPVQRGVVASSGDEEQDADGAPLHELLAKGLSAPHGAVDAATGNRQPAAADAAPSALTGTAKACHQRLAILQAKFGRYPAKHRPLAWRFLLRLPNNHSAASDLWDRGTHATWADLANRFPVRDSRLLNKLSKVLNALSHWSPVFGELPFLPALAFPFVKFFATTMPGADALPALETVMTVLVNWGRHFTETLPLPPIPLLARVHTLLQHWDSPLAAHLEACGADASRYAWPLLRSALSEVFTRAEWEAVWDCLFTHAHDPSLLLYVVVAYLRYFRVTLLGIKPWPTEPSAHPGAVAGQGVGGRHGPFNSGPAAIPPAPLHSSKAVGPGFNAAQSATAAQVVTPAVAEICALLRHQNPVNVGNVLKLALQMRGNTPAHAHPFPITEEERVLQSVGGTAGRPREADDGSRAYSGRGMKDVRPAGPAGADRAIRGNVHTASETGLPGVSQATAAQTATEGAAWTGPLHPLPAGAYPPFLRYPRFIVDYQLAERQRIAAAEETLQQKRAAAAAHAQHAAQLRAEESAWRAEQRMAEAAEAERAAHAAAAAAVLRAEHAAVSDELKAQRLVRIATAEDAVRQEIAMQRSRRAVTSARLTAEAAAVAKDRDAAARERLAEEALLDLEQRADERVRALRAQLAAEEEEAVARDIALARMRAADSTDATVAAAWRAQDEGRRASRIQQLEETEKLTREATERLNRAAAAAEAQVAAHHFEAATAAVARERSIVHPAAAASSSSAAPGAGVADRDENAPQPPPLLFQTSPRPRHGAPATAASTAASAAASSATSAAASRRASAAAAAARDAVAREVQAGLQQVEEGNGMLRAELQQVRALRSELATAATAPALPPSASTAGAPLLAINSQTAPPLPHLPSQPQSRGRSRVNSHSAAEEAQAAPPTLDRSAAAATAGTAPGGAGAGAGSRNLILDSRSSAAAAAAPILSPSLGSKARPVGPLGLAATRYAAVALSEGAGQVAAAIGAASRTVVAADGSVVSVDASVTVQRQAGNSSGEDDILPTQLGGEADEEEDEEVLVQTSLDA